MNPRYPYRALLAATLFCTSFPTIARDTEKIDQNAIDDVVVTAETGHNYQPGKVGVADKMPQEWRDVPQSVSVVTRKQMDDQNLQSMDQALQRTTGITVIANDNLNNQYYARGYGLGVMYDGVASYNGMTPSAQFDLPLYERIEVLRGAEGLLRGSGDPGGVVNLVKKRPQQKFAAYWAANAGSWDNYHLEGDLTGAVNQSGSLRLRAIAAGENRRYFYEHSRGKKSLGALMAEYDLTPNTLLSLSYSAQNHDVNAAWSGLPVLDEPDAHGVYPLLDVSRSTNPVPEWNKYFYHTREISTSLQHTFDKQWQVKLSFNRRTQDFYFKEAYINSGVDPKTGQVGYSSSIGDYTYTRDGADLYGGGPFHLFGREHHFLIGLNAEQYHNQGKSGRGPSFENIPFGKTDTLTEPDIAYNRGSDSLTWQGGLYSKLRVQIAEPLTVILGGRLSTFRAKSRSVYPSQESGWKSGAQARNYFTPSTGVVYQPNQTVSFYGSYASIFVPQNQLKADGSVLDPRSGRQWEVGTKASWMDGKLNASLAYFNLRDINRSYPDPNYPKENFYLNAGKIESKGWEAEISGAPYPGWDIIAGYTYLTTRYLKDARNQGLVYSIQTPKHQLKLWTQYHFPQQSPLSGLSIGAGVLAQSKTQSSRGWRNEILNSGYAIVNTAINYQINHNYSIGLQANNIFDKKYYASVGTDNTYNFYGEPRSFLLTLRGQY